VSNVSGQISVNLSFSDTTSLPTKTVLKSIGIAEDVEVLGEQVAIVSGTVGTAAVNINLEPTVYRNASGAFVSFTTAPTRIILQASGTNEVRLLDSDLNVISLYSKNNIVASSAWGGGSTAGSGVSVQATGGTNSYAIVIVREV
jgi:hypothetical protein